MQSTLCHKVIVAHKFAQATFFCCKPRLFGDNEDVDTEQKLNILAESSKFDLACACKHADEPGRRRGPAGRWIYPAALPSGRKVFLLKTLQTNACANDCSYCPFNARRDLARTTVGPDELARTFIDMLDANRVSGLFLSSGVPGEPDQAMDRMLATVELVRRRHQFRGFVHLKVLPGSSPAAIEQAVRLATRVSVNIEAPNAQRLAHLSQRKRFYEDIVAAIENIARLRQQLNPRCQQTTQFVVGAAGESDREIATTTARLYHRFKMERVYFSAYQPPGPSVTTEQPALFDDVPTRTVRSTAGSPLFTREHRLYQVDFLFRRYGFALDDIAFDAQGQLDLDADPKLIWARNHPQAFPVNVNYADRHDLLRVPGIGPIGAQRILKARKISRIQNVQQLRALGLRSSLAWAYVCF